MNSKYVKRCSTSVGETQLNRDEILYVSGRGHVPPLRQTLQGLPV